MICRAMVLGVPFYGYCWGNCGGGQTSTYLPSKDIVAKYPSASGSDWLDINGAQSSYNGVSTMSSKTALARQYGGIMLWELSGDLSTTSTQSLLRAVDGASH